MDDKGADESPPSTPERRAIPRSAVLALAGACLVWALADVRSIAIRQGWLQRELVVVLALVGLVFILAGRRGVRHAASGRDRTLSRVAIAAGVLVLAAVLGIVLFFPVGP